MEATTLNRPWADLDYETAMVFVSWVARQAGVDLSTLDATDDELAQYAVTSFVDGIAKIVGGDENTVKSLVEWVVTDPVTLRFVLNRYRESEIVRRQPLEGGILDQKLIEADALISAIWRYVP